MRDLWRIENRPTTFSNCPRDGTDKSFSDACNSGRGTPPREQIYHLEHVALHFLCRMERHLKPASRCIFHTIHSLVAVMAPTNEFEFATEDISSDSCAHISTEACGIDVLLL